MMYVIAITCLIGSLLAIGGSRRSSYEVKNAQSFTVFSVAVAHLLGKSLYLATALALAYLAFRSFGGTL